MLNYLNLMYMKENKRLELSIREIKYREGKTQKAISLALGYNERYLSDLVNARFPLTEEVATRISEHYAYISLDWLLYGEGEMLVEDKKKIESNAKMIDTSIVMVPMVPYGARAGSALGYADLFEEEKNMTYPVYVMPGESLGHDVAVFHVEGASMSPKFEDGDVVLAKYLDPSYYKDFRLNIRTHPYWVILTTEGVIVKNIIDHNVAQGTITCHSANPDYDDFTISLSEVFRLYYIKRLVGREF